LSINHLEMLVGVHGNEDSALVEAVDALDDASTLFVAAWTQNKREQAQRASDRGISSLDHIVNRLLRERDNYRRNAIYSGSAFETAMRVHAGLMMPNATHLDHQAIATAAAGQGMMPSASPTVSIGFETLLNKIKHRNRDYANFRLSGIGHRLIICPDKPGGSPESVVEFDVGNFCNIARAVIAHL
jgi:hypothetical protein